MKNKNLINVYQYLKNKEKANKNTSIKQRTNYYFESFEDSSEETTSTKKKEKDFLRESFSSADYFLNKSSISSCSNVGEENLEKEKKFEFTSKNKFFPEDFDYLNLMGSGAYARVYRARNKQTGNIYAIKMIDKVIMDKEGKLFQIYIENEFLNIFNHPKIVKTFGIFEDKERFNLVLEYVPKGTLSHFIEKTNASIDKNILIYFTAQLVSIVEYLNIKNVVHRDIKPDNILIDSNYNLKLIDFATAFYPDKYFDTETYKYLKEEEFSKLSEERKFKILRNQLCQGTPNYMAPEVISNNFKCGVYSDLWSIGCVLYNMVYGVPPFNDKTEYLVFQNILNLNYRFPPNKSISPDTKDLIKSLLKLNPMERISSNGKLDALKNHCFFNSFDPSSIKNDLDNYFNAIKGRRNSIEYKKNPENELARSKVEKIKNNEVNETSKFLVRRKKFSTDKSLVLNIYGPNSKLIAIKDEQENANQINYFQDYSSKKHREKEVRGCFSNEKIKVKNPAKESNKQLNNLLKFEMSNKLYYESDLKKNLVKSKEKIEKNNFFSPRLTLSKFTNSTSIYRQEAINKKALSPIIDVNNKPNILPIIKIQHKKSDKTNLEILLSHDDSAYKIIKIGVLKMLSPWNFFDNRKIIFYKNSVLEYYDVDKNELKGTIYLDKDFTAFKKDIFQFDLIKKGKVFSFISRKEEEIKEWVDIINKHIIELKLKCKNSK